MGIKLASCRNHGEGGGWHKDGLRWQRKGMEQKGVCDGGKVELQGSGNLNRLGWRSMVLELHSCRLQGTHWTGFDHESGGRGGWHGSYVEQNIEGDGWPTHGE